MTEYRERLGRLDVLKRPLGEEQRCLRLGDWEVLLEGLDADLAASLDRRWGGFLAPWGGAAPRLRLRLFEAPPSLGLGPGSPGQPYRLEGAVHEGRPVALSHHFVLGSDPGTGRSWRGGVIRTVEERTDRTVENAIRYLVARAAVEDAGFALHGAGIERQGRAYVFAGPSGSGKTTVVDLSAPAPSLGDDFALLLSRRDGWFTAAVPFDNREKAPADPLRGFFPVAGVWRLYHEKAHRVEVPQGVRAIVSLMACAVFPWAMPDLAGKLLDQVQRFAAEATFGHLHFAPTPAFWELLGSGDREA